MSSVRVRFAPSPTGNLHIGGVRTALFNWLFARASGGEFLLRIEDTDRERSKAEFTEDILESLRWLGLDWDEEPLSQFSRLERHKELAEQLLKEGRAYRCDCTPKMLEQARAQCAKEKCSYGYPGTCRNKMEVTGPSVVRVKTPESGETVFEDQIRGKIAVPNADIEDWVILRSNGVPTYNFVVVVDDHDQAISHVLRGEDHINNTPKQLQVYEAFGWEAPQFAHLPMILGSDRAKLSKRHGAASTLEYRRLGYLPAALINFLVRLGWSHGDQEIFSVDELKQLFSLKSVGKANAVFNQEKLVWISGRYFRETPASQLVEYMKRYFAEDLVFAQGVELERLEKGVTCNQEKVKTVPEVIERLHCLFGEDPHYDTGSLKDSQKELFKEQLTTYVPIIEASDFSAADLESRVRQEVEKQGAKFGKVAQAIRWGVTGGKISPGLFEMLHLQGKEVALRRLQKALAAFN